MANWKELLDEAFTSSGDSWQDVEFNSMTQEQMEKEFYDGYGAIEGCAFGIWTKNFVYFPAVYDGAEWVDWIPRNPCGPIGHIGSG